LPSSQPDDEAPRDLPAPPLDPAALALFEEVLASGAELRVRVTGRSMASTLRAGDVVTIRSTAPGLLRKGDLVLVKNSQDAPVLHRLIKTSGPEDARLFHTKADAIRGLDEPVPENRVLGKVCRAERPYAAGATREIDLESPCQRLRSRLLAVGAQLRLFVSR